MFIKRFPVKEDVTKPVQEGVIIRPGSIRRDRGEPEEYQGAPTPPADFMTLRNQVHSMLFHYAQAAPGEVSGLAKVEMYEHSEDIDESLIREGDGHEEYEPEVEIEARITGIYMLPQVSNAAYTQLDEEAQADFLCKLYERGEDPMDYNCWWHVHPAGHLGWSQTDEENIAQYSKEFPFISLLMEKNGLMTARWDLGNYSDNLTVAVRANHDMHLKKMCYNQVAKKVREFKHVFEVKGVPEKILSKKDAESIDRHMTVARENGILCSPDYLKQS